MKSYQPLFAVLIAYALLSGLYSWLVPPFEGPDEPQHYAYVEWLALGRGFPPQGEAAWQTPVRQEAGQPPLYYWLASIPARVVGVTDPAATFRPNPHFPSAAAGTVADNKNVAIHYPSDTHPIRGGWLALYLARGVSLLFGVVLIVAIHGLARQVFPATPQMALLSAVQLSVLPQVLFLSSTVSNDVAVAATSTVTLWCLAVLLRHGYSARWSVALGLALGAALLCKVSALALLLPIGVGLIWLWISRRRSWRQTLLAGGWIVAIAALVAGWWYLRSWRLSGSPLGLTAHLMAPWASSDTGAMPSAAARWREVFFSFWAAFGWGNIKPFAWAYYPLLASTLAAAAGLVVGIWQWGQDHRRKDAGHCSRRVGLTTLSDSTSIILLGLLWLIFLGVCLELAIWMAQVTAPHGRLLFPALGAVTLLLVAGLRRVGRWLCWLNIGYVAALALLSLPLLVHPAYASPRLVEADRLAPSSMGFYFGSFAELYAVNPLERSVHAGETFSTRVCWRPLGRADKDYSVFLHLVGPGDQLAAARHTYPGLGSYPTSTWTPSEPFCDILELQIPADLSQTLVYRIEVGLVDIQTMERLAAVNSAGRLVESAFVGQVRLVTSQPAVATSPVAGSGAIRLLGYEMADSMVAGGQYDLTLRWWVAEEVNQDLTVYIHLQDPDSGRTVTQADGPPLDGWYPTSWWIKGETVVDRHLLGMPLDMPPGQYEVQVGWYDLGSGERMGDAYQLQAVEVRP